MKHIPNCLLTCACVNTNRYAANPTIVGLRLDQLEEHASNLALGEVEHVLCQGFIEKIQVGFSLTCFVAPK